MSGKALSRGKVKKRSPAPASVERKQLAAAGSVMRKLVNVAGGVPRSRPVKKMAISLEADLAEDLQRSANALNQGNVSAWVADAVRQKMRLVAAHEVMAEFEAENGPITDDELAKVRSQWPRD